jgi:hypothetical protein
VTPIEDRQLYQMPHDQLAKKNLRGWKALGAPEARDSLVRAGLWIAVVEDQHLAHASTVLLSRTDNGSHSPLQIRFAVQSTPLPEARDADRREDRLGCRHVRQIELCAPHGEVVIERERARGLEISDRRNE